MTGPEGTTAQRVRTILRDPFAAHADVLDERERLVAALAARGKTYVEIGQALGVSTNTAGSIVKRITRKLGTDKAGLPAMVLDMIGKAVE